MQTATSVTLGSKLPNGQSICHSKRPCEMRNSDGTTRPMKWWERNLHTCKSEQGGY